MCLAATESVNHGPDEVSAVFDDQDYELKEDVLWLYKASWKLHCHNT